MASFIISTDSDKLEEYSDERQEQYLEENFADRTFILGEDEESIISSDDDKGMVMEYIEY